MEKSYKIKVNDLYDFDLKESDLDFLRKGKNQFHLIDNNESFKVTIDDSDFAKKNYRIKVNGAAYQVSIQDSLDQMIQNLGLSVGAKQKDLHLFAPMPGLILEVQVSEGQEVKEGDALLVLEAMKMENLLVAPKEGTVKSIKAIKGDAVDKKQLLIELE